MKWLRGLLVLFTCIFGLPCLCKAQIGESSGERRTIEGHVFFSKTNQPAPNVIVSLRSSEGLSLDDTKTGLNGEFAFHGLRPAAYTLSVDLQGYQPISMTVDVTMASSRGNDIGLRESGGNKQTRELGSPISVHILSMPDEARGAFEAGKQKLSRDKNANGSLEDFQRAVQIAPNFYEAYAQMGVAYLQLGKPDESEKALRKAIELSQDKYAPADFDLGALEMNRRQFSDGEKIIRHGLELDPNAWIGHYELGRALFYERHIPEALKSAEEARALQPNAAVLYRLLALIHMTQHNNPALLQDLDIYIKLDPDSSLGLRAQQLREQVARSMAPQSAAHQLP